jgi:hypothetical protein
MGVKFGLILREEYTLMVFENSVLKRIFGPNRKVSDSGLENIA